MNAVAPLPPTRLMVLGFDIVGGCQLRCVGCPNSTLRPKAKPMAVADFARCMANIDVDRIDRMRMFNYGEPLLHPDLPGIFRVLADHRDRIASIEISTNAQFARWGQIEEVMHMKLLTHLAVSCDGDGTPESYERLRPPGRWPKLIEFLTRVGEMRERLDPNLQLFTRTVISKRADMERWTSVLEPLGWRAEFRGWKILPQSAENPSGRELVPGQGACVFVEALTQLYVAGDGTVVPCCVHPRAGELGSLLTSKWSEIAEGPKRASFIHEMESNRAAMEICSACEFGPSAARGASAGFNLPAQ
jgi:MoaA/NifB/PqqE/SkfB family radical SAM enzyme